MSETARSFRVIVYVLENGGREIPGPFGSEESAKQQIAAIGAARARKEPVPLDWCVIDDGVKIVAKIEERPRMMQASVARARLPLTGDLFDRVF